MHNHPHPVHGAGPLRLGGFTLIELLVVLVMITLLMSILLPTLSSVRASAQRATCLSNLRQLGSMIQMYLQDNNGRVMRVNPIPSDPDLLSYPAPSIVEALQPYHRGAVDVFSCPADVLPSSSDLSTPSSADTYFEQEGVSYEYNFFFNAYAVDPVSKVNRRWGEALLNAASRPPLKLSPSDLPLLVDFDAFHGRSGEFGSRNALYADFHARALAIDLGRVAGP